ncbi:MAG: tyrosine-type recombinase/integrase [Acidobacteria bacterium]|nr:tyrosine-type recombinase/integrase [Acidobacteriota bacterium]
MGSLERSSKGKWKARYRDPSGRQRSKTFDRKSEAQNFLAMTATEMVQGMWRDPELEKISFRDWIEEWWDTTVDLRPSTRVRDEAYMRNHVMPTFADLAIGDLNPRQIRQWVASLVAKGLAPATVRKAYQLLTKSLREAVDAGLLAQSPCRGISLPKIEVREMPALEPPKIVVLAQTIDARYRALVLLAAYSGMRWAELVGLTRKRIDLDKGVVEVKEIIVELEGRLLAPSPPKTKAGRRRIPIPPSVAKEIRKHLDLGEGSDFVFQSPEGGPLRKSFNNRFWVPAVKNAGVYPFRFHDLRHTAISYWILCGASPKQIAKWAGHTSTSVVLDRYGHLFPEEDDRLISSLESMFRRSMGDEEGWRDKKASDS